MSCRHLIFPACGCKRPEPEPEQAPDAYLADVLLTDEDEAREALLEEMVEKLRQCNARMGTVSLADFVKQAWSVLEPETTLEWNWHHQLLCDVMQGMFEDWIKKQSDAGFKQRAQNAAFNVPPGTGKPVHVDGLVNEQKRGLIRIGDVREGDRLLTHVGRFRDVLAVHEQGVLPLVVLTTQRGRVIKTAYDHSILTQRGWVRADEITTQDVLAEVHQNVSSGSQTMLPEEARLLGYLVGDGCVKYGGTTFTNQDDEAITDFMSCAEICGFSARNKPRPASYKRISVGVVALGPKPFGTCECGAGLEDGLSRCNTCQAYRTKEGTRLRKAKPDAERRRRSGWRSQVREWRIKHGIDGASSRDKRVPPDVMHGDEATIVNFVSAYWSCDGSIHDRRDTPRSGRGAQMCSTVRVDATTISEGLARDLQHLLLRLGLSFTIRHKVSKLTASMTTNPERVGNAYHSWQIVAADQDTAAKFIQVVSPHMRHEKRLRANNIRRNDFDHTLNADAVASVVFEGSGECRCLQIDEDESFAYEGVAVHNSRLVAVIAPVWMWLRYPSWKYICLSVNADAAYRDARLARELIKSTWFQCTFQPKWKLKGDQDALGNFGTTAGGSRLSRAAGSEIVGLRADTLICDDMNNPKEAQSEKNRRDVNTLWDTNTFNRVNDMRSSLRISVQQRVHEDDFTGHATRKGEWCMVVLPAEFETERRCVTPFGSDPRQVEGESIHESRLPPDILAAERIRFGPYDYAGQMQQRPAPIEGGMIKAVWWKWFHEPGDQLHPIRPKGSCEDAPVIVPEKFSEVVISCDLGVRGSTENDNSAFAVVGVHKADRYILELVARPMDFPEQIRVLKELRKKWPMVHRSLIEKSANAEALVSQNKHDMPGMILVPAKEEKGFRIRSCVPLIAAGNVYLRDGAAWTEDLIHEASVFPNGRRDDRIDAVVQAIRCLGGSGPSTLDIKWTGLERLNARDSR